jgi:hypothetical protein
VFLRQVARTYHRSSYHWSWTTTPRTDARGPGKLTSNPRITVHFHPDPRLLDDPVEVWLSTVETRSSVRQKAQTPQCVPSSTAGTTAPTPSDGPRPPTRSWRRPNRKTTSKTNY